MGQYLLHFLLSGGLLAVGLYLFGHPKVMSRQTRLVRIVVVWIGLVFGLRLIDYLFLW